MTPTRVTFCLTHPVQYFSPWFRHVAAERPDLDLTVLYASEPTPPQQGAGFDASFSWDCGVRTGYRSRVLVPSHEGRRFDSGDFFGVDAAGVGQAIRESDPDVVVIPGWHSIYYLRALYACRRSGIPVLYRGDTHLAAGGAWWRRPLWRGRTRALLRLFDGYLAVGTRSRELLRALDVPDPLVFASPHAVDNAAFAREAAAVTGEARRRARARLGLPSDGFVVGFAGKLTANKRPQDVIRAVQRLGGGASVLMIGGGALLEDCRDLARQAGVLVGWAGVVNQSQIGAMLAVADCLVLPSASESWGLAVNEAMACGLPCVVSHTAGCAPDLVMPGETGETFPPGDVGALSSALGRVRARLAAGHDYGPACRSRAAAHSFEAATDGVAAASRRLRARRERPLGRPGSPRVLACFGGMVIASGIERMSFEVLRALVERGAAAHCVLNRWGSSRIVELVEDVGGSWSTGYYWHRLARRTRNPAQWARMAWDVACTSAGLLRDAWRFRPTHVLAPEFGAVLRNAPALWVLRRLGVTVILRLGNAPDEGRFYRALWRHAIDPVVDRYVSNSQFIHAALLAHRIGAGKGRVVYNTAPTRSGTPSADEAADARRVIFVGQVIPEKGLDLLLEAVALLGASGRDVRLDVVGDVDGWESPSYAGYRAGIKARASAADLAGRVRLLGAREDVPALLAASALHCCPSRPEQREGFAVVMLEAKRAGIPSVVYPTGSLPEMVTHRVDGWICTDVTAAALAEGLAYFLDDPARLAAAGQAARRSDLRYGRGRFAAEWGDVFGIAAPESEPREAVA